MSTNADNDYGWQPRKHLTVECPSGKKVVIQRPGPDVILKTGRVVRGFARKAGLTEEQAKDSMTKDIADMSDEELALSMEVGREMVIAMLVSPKLVLNPRPDSNEIGPDDLPLGDYWHLVSLAMESFMDIKVPVGETEVEVSDLESFRAESSVSGVRDHGPEVRADSQQPTGDQGLVGSA